MPLPVHPFPHTRCPLGSMYAWLLHQTCHSHCQQASAREATNFQLGFTISISFLQAFLLEASLQQAMRTTGQWKFWYTYELVKLCNDIMSLHSKQHTCDPVSILACIHCSHLHSPEGSKPPLLGCSMPLLTCMHCLDARGRSFQLAEEL